MEFFKGLFGNAKKMNTNANAKKTNVMPKNNASKNTVSQPFTPGPAQSGGVAPVNFVYPTNMRQPSEDVLKWATTAGLPTPLTGMGNVAHGGAKRKNRSRKNKSRKNKSHKNKSRKNKSRKNRSRKNRSRKN